MALLARLRVSQWLCGALLLVLVGALVAPAAYYLGTRRWPLVAGLAAGLVLVLGAIENAWRGRPLPKRHRPSARRRFRVFPGGKDRDKGNGHAKDLPDDDGDKPRWVM